METYLDITRISPQQFPDYKKSEVRVLIPFMDFIQDNMSIIIHVFLTNEFL